MDIKKTTLPIYYKDSPNRLTLVEEWDESLALETNNAYMASHETVPVGFIDGKFFFGGYPESMTPFLAHWHIAKLKRFLGVP